MSRRLRAGLLVGGLVTGTFTTIFAMWGAKPASATQQYQLATTWGQFAAPPSVNGITVGGSGSVFVTDQANRRIEKYNSSGALLMTFGSIGLLSDVGLGTPGFDGVAVDSSDDVYVADSENDVVKKYDSSGNLLTSWGTAGSGIGEFHAASGLALGSSGDVYVADSGNNRIEKFDSNGNFLTSWGDVGSGNGEFNRPAGVATDASGTVYVVDQFNYRVETFDSNGNFLASWGSVGLGNGQFRVPSGIGVDTSGNVYVSDLPTNRVEKFDSSGNYLATWGGSGSAGNYCQALDPEICNPLALAVGSSGNVYVGGRVALPPPSLPPSPTIGQVSEFDSNGASIQSWSPPFPSASALDGPNGVAVDSVGDVYVADRGNARIEKFDSNGNFLTSWNGCGTAGGCLSQGGLAVATDGLGDVYVGTPQKISKFDSVGNFLTSWLTAEPCVVAGVCTGGIIQGLTADSSGDVYVADYTDDIVDKFDSIGTLLATIGSPGSGNGQLNSPEGLAVDSSGNLYVGDYLNCRIERFDSNGNYMTSWPQTSGCFYPPALAVDGSGDVYATDWFTASSTRQIHRFDSNGNLLASWTVGDPVGIAVDASGNVYVANYYGNAVEKYSLVPPGPLDHIVLSPASATIAAGESQTYAASGYDASGTSLGVVTAGTTFSISPNGSCIGAICSATEAGPHTVTGTDGSKTGTAALTVTAGPLDQLVLAPASGSIGAGGSHAYTTEGFDAYGNDLGDVTPSTIFTITPNGSCTGASCSATTAGAHTVTGTDNSFTATASLAVTAGPLANITVSPGTATVTAGESQAYTAEGFDSYGNSLGSVTGSTTFTITPNGSCTGASCGATTAGSHIVTGADGTVTGTASLRVGFCITTTLLPDATRGGAYSTQLQAVGGSMPYRWKLIGALPRGLKLHPNGLMSGNAKAKDVVKTYILTVQATTKVSKGHPAQIATQTLSLVLF